jgi:hypothetical protein
MWSALSDERTGLSFARRINSSLMLRPTVSRPVCLGINHPSGAYNQILLLSEICRFVDVGRSLSREEGSVVYNCCWPSRAQFILESESHGTRDHILLPQIRDFHFRRLLRLAGLWWRYLTRPPHGMLFARVRVRVMLRPTVSRPVCLVTEHLSGA